MVEALLAAAREGVGMTSCLVRTGLQSLAAAGAVLLGGAAAHALSLPLNIEFDDGLVGNYGNVEVTEVAGGDLFFELTLETSTLGPEADFHEFYFNLPDVDNLTIASTDTVTTPYELDFDPGVSGGAGSSWVWAVNLGQGASTNGNGILQTATFTLSADTDLSEDDLLISSSTNNAGNVYVAAHIQGTDLTNAGSETVGSAVPEPATFLLGALGLAWIGGRQRFASTTRLRPPSLAS
jgi:hypothetical protein